MTNERYLVRVFETKRVSRIGSYELSAHARDRMNARGITPLQVETVIGHGQKTRDRGAILFRVGRRIAAALRAEGEDADELEGLQVLISEDRTILTVYRNHEFRRPLETRSPHRHSQHRGFQARKAASQT